MSRSDPLSAIDLASPAALLRLVTGYWLSQAVHVAAQLGIADHLRDGPKAVEELASETGAHAPSLARLLRALTAFDICREDGPGRFVLTPLGTCLRADAPNSVRDAVLMYGGENIWRSWGDLLHCVQTGESAMSHLFGAPNPFDYYGQHPDLRATMSAGFAAVARMESYAVVAAYDFSDRGVIVDVGGGQGQLLATILQAHPAVRGILFDLPAVVEHARPLLERAGVADRCATEGGDAFTEIPSGGDTYILSRVIHDWDDEHALAILRNCQRAMRPGAALLMVEAVLPDRVASSTTAQHATLADLNMLVRTGGRERTSEEYAILLHAAGFILERIIPTALSYSMILGART